MESEKRKFSRRNLKKSLLFAGGVGFSAIGLGLAVSIPVYYAVKKELAEEVSKTADLSSFMSGLAQKLGVEPDETFVKTLQGGYELAYTNGEVKIYKTKNGKRVLFMNMNKDGTVGTAANYSGPAARGLTKLMKEATRDLKKEGNALKDILKPFVDQTKKKSRKIESSVIGLTEDEIRARNALANRNKKEAEAAFDKLNKELKKAGRPLVSRDKAQRAADKAFEEKKNTRSNINKRLAELRKKMQAAKDKLKRTFIKSSIQFYKDWHNRIRPKRIVKASPEDAPFARKILGFGSESELNKFLKTKELPYLRKLDEALTNIINILVAQARAKATKDRKVMESTNDNNIFQRIVDNPVSLLSALARSLGYIVNPNDSIVYDGITPSKTVRDKIIDYAVNHGYSRKTLDRFISYFKKIGAYDTDQNRLTKRISISEPVNTTSLRKDSNIAGLIVFEIETSEYKVGGKLTLDDHYIISKKINFNENGIDIFIPEEEANGDHKLMKDEIEEVISLYNYMWNKSADDIKYSNANNRILRDIAYLLKNKSWSLKLKSNLKLLHAYLNLEQEPGSTKNIWFQILENKVDQYFLDNVPLWSEDTIKNKIEASIPFVLKLREGISFGLNATTLARILQQIDWSAFPPNTTIGNVKALENENIKDEDMREASGTVDITFDVWPKDSAYTGLFKSRFTITRPVVGFEQKSTTSFLVVSDDLDDHPAQTDENKKVPHLFYSEVKDNYINKYYQLGIPRDYDGEYPKTMQEMLNLKNGLRKLNIVLRRSVPLTSANETTKINIYFSKIVIGISRKNVGQISKDMRDEYVKLLKNEEYKTQDFENPAKELSFPLPSLQDKEHETYYQLNGLHGRFVILRLSWEPDEEARGMYKLVATIYVKNGPDFHNTSSGDDYTIIITTSPVTKKS